MSKSAAERLCDLMRQGFMKRIEPRRAVMSKQKSVPEKHGAKIDRQNAKMPKPMRDVLSPPPSKVSTLPAPPCDEGTLAPSIPKARELRVVRTATSEIVHRVPISADKSDRQVEKVMSGMLRNMADEFHVEDSKDDKS